MIYYPHYINDFTATTRHLSHVEHSMLRMMMDMSYRTEAPLMRDIAMLSRQLCARSDEELAAVTQVLAEFFTETADGWINARCEREIAAYQDGLEKSSAGGKAKAAKMAEAEEKAKKLLELATKAPVFAKNPEILGKNPESCDFLLAQNRSVRFSASTETQAASTCQPEPEPEPELEPELEPEPESKTTTTPAPITQIIERDQENGNRLASINPVVGGSDFLIAVLRDNGVTVTLDDHPKIAELARQGVTADTLIAACLEAKKSKAGKPIRIGYVIGILERWAREAAAVKVLPLANVRPPVPRTALAAPDADAEMARRKASNDNVKRMLFGTPTTPMETIND